MKLTDFKILTFDCYGTLIDWETGMVEALKPLTSKVGQLSRDKILETHAYYESTQQLLTPEMPYSRLLATVYRRMAEEFGVSVSWDECVTYGQSVGNWPAFDDTPAALQYLKQHYKLCILSNVDPVSFAKSNERLGVEFDYIFTAEDIGSYKPADKNFEYMISQLARLGYGKSDILHTAESMFHDHKPANRHGLASAWIHRRHDKEGFGATMHPGDMPSYNFRFTSMGEMAKAHQDELKQP